MPICRAAALAAAAARLEAESHMTPNQKRAAALARAAEDEKARCAAGDHDAAGLLSGFPLCSALLCSAMSAALETVRDGAKEAHTGPQPRACNHRILLVLSSSTRSRCCRLAAFAASSAAGDWAHVDRKSATLGVGPDLPTDTPTPSEPASQHMAVIEA